MMDQVFGALRNLAELGGPVVLVLVALSVVALTVVLFKFWQFHLAGVGQRKSIDAAIFALSSGTTKDAQAHLADARSYLAPLVQQALDGRGSYERLAAEAEARFARLEKGFRLLDTIAQLSPLLGLFGTVLGMISAFQALQDAGSQVDPSILAGGIWVALMTTAVGLAVAMPVASLLSWFEARMDAERVLADQALRVALEPQQSAHTASAHTSKPFGGAVVSHA